MLCNRQLCLVHVFITPKVNPIYTLKSCFSIPKRWQPPICVLSQWIYLFHFHIIFFLVNTFNPNLNFY